MKFDCLICKNHYEYEDSVKFVYRCMSMKHMHLIQSFLMNNYLMCYNCFQVFVFMEK